MFQKIRKYEKKIKKNRENDNIVKKTKYFK